MKFWYDVIEQSKHEPDENIYVLNESKQRAKEVKLDVKKTHALVKRNYYVGARYPDLYFTQREAECLFYLMRGLTIVATAKMLDLSPRTVEFYVKNMKIKIGVRTKNKLIEKLNEVNFMHTLRESGL